MCETSMMPFLDAMPNSVMNPIVVATFSTGTIRSLALAVGAGILYGLVAVLVRDVTTALPVIEWVSLISLATAFLTGAWFIQLGYAAGPPDLVVAGQTVVNPIVAAWIGIKLLGEGTGMSGLTQAGLIISAIAAVSGTVVLAPNMGWVDLPVATELEARLGLPVVVENEANLAALAEQWTGAAVGIDDFVCVFGEVGVGGGIVLGGRLFRGTHGFGGEFGHISVDPEGRACACGSRGCVETFVGQESIARAAGISPVAGRPRIAVASMGQLVADQVRVFLREVESNGKAQPIPDRMIAVGQVEVDSPELLARTRELVANFRIEAETAADDAGTGLTQFDIARNAGPTARIYQVQSDRMGLEVALRGRRAAPTGWPVRAA